MSSVYLDYRPGWTYNMLYNRAAPLGCTWTNTQGTSQSITALSVYVGIAAQGAYFQSPDAATGTGQPRRTFIRVVVDDVNHLSDERIISGPLITGSGGASPYPILRPISTPTVYTFSSPVNVPANHTAIFYIVGDADYYNPVCMRTTDTTWTDSGGVGVQAKLEYSPTEQKYPVTYYRNRSASDSTHVQNDKSSLYSYIIQAFPPLDATWSCPTGYQFVSWNTSRDGSGARYPAESIYTTNAPLLLYAQYIKEYYTVSYMDGYTSSGGSEVPGYTHQVVYNDHVAYIPGFTRWGWKFLGWATSNNGTVLYPDNQSLRDNYRVTGNVVFYAVWRQNIIWKKTSSGWMAFTPNETDPWHYIYRKGPSGWALSARVWVKRNGKWINVNTGTEQFNESHS